MRRLTPQLLRNFPYTQYTSAAVVARGRAYYQQGRVDEVEVSNNKTAFCLVSGDSGEYQVEIEASSAPGGVTFDCECPHAAGGAFCKHMVAAGLEVADLLEYNTGGASDIPFSDDDGWAGGFQAPPAPKRTWQNQMAQLLAVRQLSSGTSQAQPSLALVFLVKLDHIMGGYGGYGYESVSAYTLTPYVVPAAEWPALANAQAALSPQEMNALLEADTSWIRHGHLLGQATNQVRSVNLDFNAVALLNELFIAQSAYNYGPTPQPVVLSLLARLDVPVFLGDPRRGQVERRLRLLTDPVDVSVDLRPTEAGLSLLAGIERDGQFVPLQKASAAALVTNEQPAWALLDDVLAQLRDPRAIDLLRAFPLNIPAREIEAFRGKYFTELAQKLPLRAGIVTWQDVRADPLPRLYLRDDKVNRLSAELRFDYGGHELPALKNAPPVTIAAIPDTWDLVRIHRQPEAEAAHYQELASATFDLKRGASNVPDGTVVLRARVHPFDFLLRTIPRLAAAGYEIFGEQQLKLGKVNRSTPTLRVSISSGIDWFDLKTVVEFGDQQISLHAVRKALQKGERFVKLADGSAGQIPEAWLNQYRHLWKLADETADGFRVKDVHLSLLDPLLEADPSIHVPAALTERRNRLRSFEHIAPQPAPEQFNGQLRPYQQHGVDWLHFLREFGLGGILADDMGLGKTIQVLAFMQLLRERARRRGPASLLVVPKSLIANWQREAERFTPGLRVLVYVGITRSKDTASFKGSDLVLTTYGTLLRDVASLRNYKFHYVILDESQAIKNPLSQSARAARLLAAEHRLALTGTPVENNTLELWSQFAFVNPGLLGSLDFFRREFANPIEAQGDEAAAASLRRLVYPFILRRTKAQVAPELPPRAERIIYADMAPAQAKLYARTREHYRAELLGLIESQGLNDARFKILEGLLRLRQIAIHPRLMDSSYRGEAPKLDILLETLETLNAENHKVLVFSQFVGMLKLVRRELDTRRMKYVYLDGQTPQRQARVDQFQNDAAYRFFLISLKAGGVGLNLTAADYVIHLDPWWNPAVEMQASDRAHRIGQDKPVFIYKLIARDTVEEKILQLQEKKRALVNSLVATEAGFFKSLTRDDVSQLFG